MFFCEVHIGILKYSPFAYTIVLSGAFSNYNIFDLLQSYTIT